MPKACWDELHQQPLIFYFLSGECTFHLKALPDEYTSNGANPAKTTKSLNRLLKEQGHTQTERSCDNSYTQKKGKAKYMKQKTTEIDCIPKSYETVHSLQISFVSWLGMTLLQVLTASLMSLRAWGMKIEIWWFHTFHLMHPHVFLYLHMWYTTAAEETSDTEVLKFFPLVFCTNHLTSSEAKGV